MCCIFHSNCLICINKKKIKKQKKELERLTKEILNLMKFKTMVEKNLIPDNP